MRNRKMVRSASAASTRIRFDRRERLFSMMLTTPSRMAISSLVRPSSAKWAKLMYRKSLLLPARRESWTRMSSTSSLLRGRSCGRCMVRIHCWMIPFCSGVSRVPLKGMSARTATRYQSRDCSRLPGTTMSEAIMRERSRTEPQPAGSRRP
jgi:hypothetical protein